MPSSTVLASSTRRGAYVFGVLLLTLTVLPSRPAAAFCILNASGVNIQISQSAGHGKGGRLQKFLAPGERYCRNWKDARTNAQGTRQARLRFRISTIHAPAKGPTVSLGGLDVPIRIPSRGPTQVDVGVSETICDAWVGAAQTLTISGRPGKVVGSRVRGGRWTCSTGRAPQQKVARPPAPTSRHAARPEVAPPPVPVPAPRHAHGASAAQCTDDYRSCLRGAQRCESSREQRYQQCADGLAAKFEACNRWYDSRRPDTYGPPSRAHGRQFVHPDCVQFRRVAAYCGTRRSAVCDRQKHACSASLHQCQASMPPAFAAPEAAYPGQHAPSSAPQPIPALPRVPEPAARGYAVTVRNDCDGPTSVAYHYQALDGDWVTAGWINPDAGAAERLPIVTETPELYLHTTVGTLAGSKKNRLVLEVINPAFSHVRGRNALDGDGKRTVRFDRFAFPARAAEAVAVVTCDAEAGGDAKSVPQRRYAHTVKDQPIIQAAVNRDWARVKTLVASGVPIDVESRRYGGLLHIATVTGSDAMVTWLLEQGALVRVDVPIPPSRLHLDIRNSAARLDRFLKPSGAGPLAAAIWYGRGGVAQQLVDASAEVATLNPPQQASLIAGAAYQCLPDVVRLLMTHGVDVTQADTHGRNAAHWAVNTHNLAYKRLTDTLEVLQAAGVDLDTPDARGMTPLMYAAERGDLKHVKWLLEHGADATRTSASGRTLAALARSSRNAALVKFLSDLDAPR